MLDTDTKRRIDTARDILVGKVPDPKSQVEQITIALIYKFMDDMDAESEELGGKRKFFTGAFARYGWAKLMDRSLGGHEMLALYGEGISRMPENPGIPALFRDIFKNAYLPYRDPETLKAFLKIIDEFSYDHSERLGDAFEYLLSVLGSQGDAGQFRTPRHIIDFMVEIIQPQKHETILDPACGTAGFLISAYKHILKMNCGFSIEDCGLEKEQIKNPKSAIQNIVGNRGLPIADCELEDQQSKISNPKSKIQNTVGNFRLPIEDCGLEKEQIKNPKSAIQNTMTPDERGRLSANIRGYDISPDMVRLSLVNLYLHGFTDPHIYKYDTLTSEERWNEYADVILANPPFMSPKGGIKPHKRFSIQAKRSEVLFVDYMAEHLTPTGRAAIIVPEGIIFQSQTAYKQLRKMLVEEYLVAVVSLPAGCFNPYSGVKTSILILDKSLARQSDTIAFFKVENDGFGLGAQRRAIEKNDLPDAMRAILDFRLLIADCGSEGNGGLEGNCGLRIEDCGLDFPNSKSTISNPKSNNPNPKCLIVPKEKVAANGDYNLSGERYREGAASNHSFPLVFLGEESLFRVESGGTPKTDVEQYWGGGIPWATLVDLPATDFISQITATKRTISDKGLRESSAKLIPENSVVISTRATIGRIAINRVPIATNQGFKNVVIEDSARAMPEYVAIALTKLVPIMQAWATGGTFAEISKSKFCELQIPLPPLSIQKEIVAEIEGYQKVINGARAVLDNYRPHIPIDPEWLMVELGEVCEVRSGGTPSRSDDSYWNGNIPWVGSTVCKDGEVTKAEEFITDAGLKNSAAKLFPKDTTLIALVGATIGKTGLLKFESTTNQNIAGVYPKSRDVLEPVYLFHAAQQLYPEFMKLGEGKFRMANLSFVRVQKIPLPPLATQQAIVAQIEAEQALVAANRELITRFEQKIQASLARVWGDEHP